MCDQSRAVASTIRGAIESSVGDIRNHKTCAMLSWPSSNPFGDRYAATPILIETILDHDDWKDVFPRPVKKWRPGMTRKDRYSENYGVEDFSDGGTRLATYIAEAEKIPSINILDSNNLLLANQPIHKILPDYGWALIVEYDEELRVYVKKRSVIIVHKPLGVALDSRPMMKLNVLERRCITSSILHDILHKRDDTRVEPNPILFGMVVRRVLALSLHAHANTSVALTRTPLCPLEQKM